MLPVKHFIRLFILLFVFSCLQATGATAGISERSEHDTRRQQDSVFIIGQLRKAFQRIEENKHPQAEKRFFQSVDSILRTAEKKGLLLMAGRELNHMGEQLRYEARYRPAIWLHKKAIAIGEKTGNNKLVIISNNDLGVVFRRIDSYQKAMKYHLKALRLATRIGDSVSRAMAINSIGNVYLMLGNYDQALRYFRQSLRLEQNRNNPIGIAINLNNIAHVYEEKGFLDKALNYFELSLEINRKVPSRRGIAICNNDIANVLKKQGKYQEALLFSKRAIRTATEIKDFDNLAYAYVKAGSLYNALKEYNKALEYLNPGIELAKKIRARSTLEEGYNALFNTYTGLKDYKTAIQYLKLKQAYHDSLINLDVQKNIARMQIQFDTERQKSQMQLEQQKTKIAMLQVKKQKYLLYFAWSAFAIVLIILAFVIYYLITKSRQNRLLLEKTKEIEAAEEELKKSNRALQEAIKKVENSAKAKTDFLANISHEIRTPLNSVIGFSDLLYSMAADERQKNYLRTIKSSGESLLGLINDILDLSKIEEGNIDLEFKETDIARVINDVINIFSLEASNKGLLLTAEIDKSIPPSLIFEEARLRQILLNLVGNGIKFTEEGSVAIHAFALPSGPGPENEVTLEIEVSDTGPGISDKDQEVIFMPFHQAQTSQKASGAGLGLSITQRMVKAMNGEIKLNSALGKGSRFTTVFYHVKLGRHAKGTTRKTGYTNHNGIKKCLFINEPGAIKEDILQIFVSYGFHVENVGLNLSQARKKMVDYRLIVFCCLEEEILKNAWNIFEKENIENRYIFLILNLNKGFPIDETKAVAIDLYQQPPKDTKRLLGKFLQEFEEDEIAGQLFQTMDKLLLKPDGMAELQQIYQDNFLPAFHTKMIEKIRIFVQDIRPFAARYQLGRLQTFSGELEDHLKDFDIVFIEKQMRIFKKAYEIFSRNK